MADTTSIASRMEKLAQLKRLKEGLTSEPVSAPAVAASETEAATSAGEELGNFPTAESAFPSESELSAQEDVLQSPSETDVDESSDASLDFDPASVWDDEPSSETSFSEGEDPASTDDAAPAATSKSDDEGINFVLKDPDAPTTSEAELAQENAPQDNAPTVKSADYEETSANGLSASALGVDDETFADFDEIAAIAGAGGVAAAVASSGPADDETVDSIDEVEVPDFSKNEIEAELLEREFENEAVAEIEAEETTQVSNIESPVATEDSEGRLSVSFDESRSTLLNHVSRQMGCSIEDVVVTALDWYLDALFGEDEEAKSA